MKKAVCFLLVLLALVATLTGCNSYKADKIDTEKIRVGIMETRGNRDSSRILFLDEELNELGSLSIKEAGLGSLFDTQLVIDNTLYIIPQGYDTRKDAKKVLEIDLSDLNITEHKIDRIAMMSVAVNEDYIYTCNNLNGVSYVNKYDIVSGETEYICFQDEIIMYLFYDSESRSLYAFGESSRKDGTSIARMHIYDENLNLLSNVDITKCGTGQNKAVSYEGNILFTSGTAEDGRDSKSVYVFNPKDESISTIELSKSNPWDLQIRGDKLYVSHFNIVTGEGGGLSVYDFATGKSVYKDFDHGVEQMQIVDGKIYILSDWKIYVYDLETLELTKTREIEPMDRYFSYLSGMFVVEN